MAKSKLEEYFYELDMERLRASWRSMINRVYKECYTADEVTKIFEKDNPLLKSPPKPLKK